MALKKSIGKLRLTSFQLQTVLTEIEATLNSRPLIYINDDINDRTIITPMHFLSINAKNGTPQIEEKTEKDDPNYINQPLDSSHELLETWKKGNRYLEEFWEIWKEQYLLSLRERSQRFNKHPRIQSTKEPKIGDVVQIKESSPRGTWKIGKIIELIKSQDGQRRAAKVIMPNKHILQRSLVHLFPLEFNEDETKDTNEVAKSMRQQRMETQTQRMIRTLDQLDRNERQQTKQEIKYMNNLLTIKNIR